MAVPMSSVGATRRVDTKYHPSNFRVWRIVGTIIGAAAVGLAAWLLFAPYDTEVVDRTVDVNGQEAIVQISRDITAWGQDAALGAAAPLAVVVVVGLAYAIAKSFGSMLQRTIAILAVFLAGGYAMPRAVDIYQEADFNASDAWRGFFSAAAVIGALVLSHLYYWNFQKKPQ
jgi:hypothetical protein